MNRSDRPAAAAEPDPLRAVETELAVLARTLEGLSRRSAIHRELDRAGYLLARTLDADGPSSITTIAARLGLDATTVTRQVATLEAAGLVLRSRDARDARVRVVELTPLGRRRMREVRHRRQDRIGHLVAEWSDADRARFGELLGRFNAAIRADAAART
jgi:DNA-binding MarR family transcriptional regulator